MLKNKELDGIKATGKGYKLADFDGLYVFVSAKLGYWHHLDNLWLIVDKGSKITPADIRNKVTEVSGGMSCFVTTIPAGVASNWAVRANKASFEWLHNNWTEKIS